MHASFVRIHPFADGNGRLARLLANLPVLRAGAPPILIPAERRPDYLRTLATWQLALGRPGPAQPLVPSLADLAPFVELCARAWTATRQLVEQARALQQRRADE